MRFQIKHEIEGRLRVHMMQNRMTFAEADTLQYYLEGLPSVTHAKVYEKTCDAVVTYTAERADIITALKQFCYDRVELPTAISGHSSREMNAEYQSRLVGQTLIHFGKKLFLPYPVRAAITAVKSAKYLYQGAHCLLQRKIEVSVLDAVAIGVSVFRGEMNTAASVMYLLGIGETLEEWTHKKSVDDLARSMSLNVSKVWLLQDGQEILVSAKEVALGDSVVVLASAKDGKVNLIAMATDGAVAKGAHAGNIIKAVAGLVGGGGGGRPNMAQAGGKNPAGIPDAIASVKDALSGMIK